MAADEKRVSPEQVVRAIRRQTRRKFSADEKIKATWAELQIWSANGSLCIGKTSDKKAALALPYQGANNAHVLEAAIRMKFKTGHPKLSSILDD